MKTWETLHGWKWTSLKIKEDPMEIKAIETEYNGYKFRSRLEARWAVFFDELGIKYEYEEEGFELDDGTRYLPDFHLTDLNMYVEVKGDPDKGEDDIERSKRFVGLDSKIKRLLILANVPSGNGINCHPVYEYIPSIDEYGTVWGFFRFLRSNEGDESEVIFQSLPYELFGVPEKSVLSITMSTLIEKKMKRYGDSVRNSLYDKYREYTGQAIFNAYDEAKSARFEFLKNRKKKERQTAKENINKPLSADKETVDYFALTAKLQKFIDSYRHDQSHVIEEEAKNSFLKRIKELDEMLGKIVEDCLSIKLLPFNENDDYPEGLAVIDFKSTFESYESYVDGKIYSHNGQEIIKKIINECPIRFVAKGAVATFGGALI